MNDYLCVNICEEGEDRNQDNHRLLTSRASWARIIERDLRIRTNSREGKIKT